MERIKEDISDNDSQLPHGGMYLLRTTQQHHVQLSALADQKANILIASSLIMLSFAIKALDVEKIDLYYYTLIPALLLTVIFAMIVISPISFKRKKKTNNPQDINPLFFGHFTNYTFPEYHKIMDNILSDGHHINEAMIKDIYQLGLVLKERKYKFLTISSKTFLFGMLVSILLFIIQLILKG